jgi:hypothetical protein
VKLNQVSQFSRQMHPTKASSAPGRLTVFRSKNAPEDDMSSSPTVATHLGPDECQNVSKRCPLPTTALLPQRMRDRQALQFHPRGEGRQGQ